MLSIENPPPDPSCSCQFPQLNSASSDEKAPHKLIDLPNPPLDHHTPLPNFSIRDYVFTARSKDIKKNWPFSLKNLQLCLKHGVKDVLPPFHSLVSVSNQSLNQSKVDSSSFEKQNTNDFVEEASRPDNNDNQLNTKPPESCIDVSSCRSGEGNDFPTTRTSVCQPDIESFADKRQSSSASETENSRKSQVAVEAAEPSGSNKTESTSRSLGTKKCRLIVKFGGNSDRNSTEDIASNCTTVSETMASKICPVCKIFSSTSNTTLNAHIDQCLSVESTPKWAADSKLTRHRIKPRKTRLMVDIYSTALLCTLEDLDRRNGTNWATVSSLPTQETEKIETTNEVKKQRVSPSHPKNAGDVGPVYIDANGTKLRILSKLNNQASMSNVVEDIGARKPLKGDKRSRYISKKKKKCLAQKHHKYLKLAPQSKKIFSNKVQDSQNSEGQEKCKGEAKSCEREHSMTKQSKPRESGALRPWICSKRRGFGKKIASQEAHQPVRCNWHLPRDFFVENGQSVLGESIAEENHVQTFTNLSENPIPSSGSNGRMEKSFHKVRVSNKWEQSPGRKRVGNLLVQGRTSDNVDISSTLMKQNSSQLGNCGTSVHDGFVLRPSNSTRNHASLRSKRAVDTHRVIISNSDISHIASTKSSRTAHAIVTKAMRFSSFRKNRSVNSRSSLTESIPNKIKKWAALKKSQERFTKKRDEQVVTCHSEVDQHYDFMHRDAENQVEREEINDEESLEGSTVWETRQERGLSSISRGEEALAFRSSSSTPQCNDHDVWVSADSSVRFGDDFLEKIDCLDFARRNIHVYGEDIAVEPSSKTSDVRSAIKSVDSDFYKLGNSFKVHSGSLQSVDGYRGLLCGAEASTGPTEPDLVNDQEMFSADEVGNGMNGTNADMELELDSEAGQGDSFPEVDPILIPGPPGSFLPSPRDMGSEDFQGNSSLTTSRVQSSQDQHDVVDGDLSDSPISAASTVSNSTAGRSDFNCSDPSSAVRPCDVQDKVRSTGAGVESSQQSSVALLQPTGAEAERTDPFDGEHLKLDRIYFEKGSLNFKNDQPCCCQKKERFSQGVALNYQESQLLRRRKLAPITIPAGGKHKDFDSNQMPIHSGLRPELAPPSSCSSSASEKFVLPVIQPLGGPIPLKDSPNAGPKLLARTDSDSASPSASNPILRLMGKNLMVVNKDEDMSVSLCGVQPHVQTNHQNSQFVAFSGVSPGNIQNHDSHPLHHLGSQASVILGKNPCKSGGQCFDGGLSNGFRRESDSRLPVHVRLPAGMFQDQHLVCGFATSMECHEYKGDHDISGRHNRLKHRLNVSPTNNDTEKVITTPDLQCRCMDSSTNAVKEIIVIPETESAASRDVAKYIEGGREKQVSPGMSIPTALSYNPIRVNPFSYYQSQDHAFLGETPMVHDTSHHSSPTKLGNACPVRWGCTPEGSSLLQRSPFTTVSSSPSHLKSATLHYSPGFS